MNSTTVLAEAFFKYFESDGAARPELYYQITHRPGRDIEVNEIVLRPDRRAESPDGRARACPYAFMNRLHMSFLKRSLDAPDPAEETCAAQNKAWLNLIILSASFALSGCDAARVNFRSPRKDSVLLRNSCVDRIGA